MASLASLKPGSNFLAGNALRSRTARPQRAQRMVGATPRAFLNTFRCVAAEPTQLAFHYILIKCGGGDGSGVSGGKLRELVCAGCSRGGKGHNL
jgi:hypothetical protein